MPLWIPQTALALAIVLTAASGTLLMINARALARLFRKRPEIEPGPGPRGASRKVVIALLVAFNLGWITTVAIWSWVASGEAEEVVEAPD